MAYLRLAIVAPRFWPLIGDGPTHLLRLAESFTAAGHDTVVVTPQWKRSWPAQMQIGIVRLLRLRGSGRGGWSTLRWMYSLRQWLSEQQLDGVLVAGLKHESYVALGVAKRGGAPAIMMAGEDDLDWQRTVMLGDRIANRCREARAVVSSSNELTARLIVAGYSSDSVKLIKRRVPLPPARSPKLREEARAALAAVNYDLVTTSNAQVALAIGRLDTHNRFSDLVRAWRIVSARRPEARLWIVGDGPERDALYQQISDLDQRFRVLLPGTFDCHEELFQASDMVLYPGQHLAPPLALLDAQAAGLPIIAADSPALRPVVAPNQTGLLHASGDMKAIAAAVLQLMEQPGQAVEFGSRTRAAVQSQPTLADETEQYLALIERQKSAVR